jgi:hypothetical protein
VIRRVWYVFRPDFFVVCLMPRVEEARRDLVPRSAVGSEVVATLETGSSGPWHMRRSDKCRRMPANAANAAERASGRVVPSAIDRDYNRIRPRRIASTTASVRVEAPSFIITPLTWNFAV